MTIKNKRKSQFRMQALMEKRKRYEYESWYKIKEDYEIMLMYGRNYKEKQWRE
jgi:hypothetical protein